MRRSIAAMQGCPLSSRKTCAISAICAGHRPRLGCATRRPQTCRIMSTATSNPPARVFYGWYVVAAVFVITTTSSGLAFYNLSILLAAFVAEQGFPVGLASSATATFFIAGSIGGVIAGRLVDRIDARIVIATGASIGALTLASAGQLGSCGSFTPSTSCSACATAPAASCP